MNSKRFYVYVHRRNDNNIVFYVGKGTGRRAYRTRTSGNHREVTELAGGYQVEILEDNLTEQEALAKEAEFITNPPDSWQLINQISVNSPKVLDFSVLNEIFTYDENSPSCLTWKINKGSTKIGFPAGYVRLSNKNKSYFVVFLDRKCYLVHRIIWVLVNGTIAVSKVINHKDGNSLNNRLDNLEECTTTHNNRNTSKHKNESTGVYKTRNSYQSVWWVDGKQHNKYFSCLKMGEEQAKAAAIAYRLEKIKDLNQLGYNYSLPEGR